MTLNISMIPKIHDLYLAHVLCFLFLHCKTPHGCHFPPWNHLDNGILMRVIPYFFFKLTAEEIRNVQNNVQVKKKKKKVSKVLENNVGENLDDLVWRYPLDTP